MDISAEDLIEELRGSYPLELQICLLRVQNRQLQATIEVLNDRLAGTATEN